MSDLTTSKKGDKVRCIDKSGAKGAYVEGKVYTVSSVAEASARDGGQFIHTEEVFAGMFSKRFELIRPFKEGDRVRFLDTINPGWWFKKGQTGVIEQVARSDSKSNHVRVDDSKASLCAFVEDHHIELIKEEPVKQEEAIKVGDTVECITDEWYWFTKGKRYEVVSISPSDNGVNMIDGEGDSAYLQFEEVRKVDPAPRFVTMWDYGHSFHPTGDKPFATEEEAEKHALAILNSGEHTEGTIAVFEVVGKHTVALTVTSQAA